MWTLQAPTLPLRRNLIRGSWKYEIRLHAQAGHLIALTFRLHSQYALRTFLHSDVGFEKRLNKNLGSHSDWKKYSLYESTNLNLQHGCAAESPHPQKILGQDPHNIRTKCAHEVFDLEDVIPARA